MCGCKNIRLTKGDKIAICVVALLLVLNFVLNVYVVISTISHTFTGICSVDACTETVIFYSWPTKGYTTSFNIPPTWNITCKDNIECSFNDRDPYGSFGGWTTRLLNGSRKDRVCLNGACMPYEWWDMRVLYISVTFQVCLISFVIYSIIRIFSKGSRSKFTDLYSAISIPTERDSD